MDKHDYTARERNLADALAEHLPEAKVVTETEAAGGGKVMQLAVPNTFALKEIDTEKLLANPRRAKGEAEMADHESFLAYITRHKTPSTVVWCDFNPQTFSLSFTAVFDDHTNYTPGWRGHRAKFAPAMSAEWKTWKAKDGQHQKQLDFAEFLERNADDINSGAENNFPTSLAMMKMATEFEATSDKRIKSAVRLSSGGVRIEYIDDADAGTVAYMSAFERFLIAIPVFWSGVAYRIEARLKWRQQDGGLKFFYELIRPDRVHEAAASNLIGMVRHGAGEVPLLMGEFK